MRDEKLVDTVIFYEANNPFALLLYSYDNIIYRKVIQIMDK
jgi:hypothetical protein